MLLHNQAIQLTWAILLVACFWPRDSQQEDVTQPEVTIPQGTLQGTTRTTRGNRTVSAFLAIPYAQPPIGDLRFANPVAADGWNGTRDASQDGNDCPQASGGSEDCLNINVYTPQLTENSSSTLLPVLVWIFGGSFVSGSPNSAEFGPEYLLDADVVLAVPNHRAGPFGYLSTGDEVASGNWGLKDQILALQWVQDNIKYFGGDPDRVTIGGYSSGAVSAQLLTLSDATKGLFHQYITQSGFALAPSAFEPRTTYASRAFELGGYVGCPNDTSASLITCLRGLNASDIVAAYSQFNVWQWLPVIVWMPTDEPDIEGAVLTDIPKNIIAAGGMRDIPWMTGGVRDEGGIFVIRKYHSPELTKYAIIGGAYESETSRYITFNSVTLCPIAFDASEDLLADFVTKFDDLMPEFSMWTEDSELRAAWIKAVKSYYFNNDMTTNRSAVMNELALLAADTVFIYPEYHTIQQQPAQTVSPTYVYSFSYRGSLSYSLVVGGTEKDYGVVHTDELIYLFEERSSFSSFNVSRSEADYRMVDTMVELWTSFVINGTPTTSANNNTVTWKAYNSAEDNYLQIGNDSDLGLEVRSSFCKERRNFWELLASTLRTSTN